MMQMAGLPHLPPDDLIDGMPYEQEYGMEWPAGYKGRVDGENNEETRT